MTVDTQERAIAAKLVDAFLNGQVTFDVLDNRWPTSETDRALSEIGEVLYASLVNDYSAVTVDKLPLEAQAILHRVSGFLRSQLEYEWPIGAGRPTPRSLFESVIALAGFRSEKPPSASARDPRVWPYIRESDCEQRSDQTP